ncbi:MAG: hypothetical protein JOZ57_03580 [Abitibacteriaceae bacterium]|nr:hypothetical protein [Abditibacteriaceae bacterium]
MKKTTVKHGVMGVFLITGASLFSGCSQLGDTFPAANLQVTRQNPVAQHSTLPSSAADSAPDQSFLGLITGNTGPTQTCIIYDDITRSRVEPGTQGSWATIKSKITQFAHSAPIGSKLEVYITGSEPGQPQLVLEYKAVALRPRVKEEELAALLRKTDAVEHRINHTPPVVSGSTILEDMYRCAVRAEALGGAGTRRSVIVLSDLQQYSSTLKHPEIQVKNFPSLTARVLSSMPKLSNPVQFSIIYFPGIAARHALNANQEQKLKDFFQEMIKAWGCPPGDFQEPEAISSENTTSEGTTLPASK